MRVLVDSREQAPFAFHGYDVEPETATLPIGDYSIPGFEDRVSIEKKTLGDLVNCLMGSNRERFERELSKGRAYDLFVIVVESTLADVSKGKYRSAIKPHAALQSLITFQVRYRVPLVWAGDRQGAEYCTYWLLQKFLREVEERYRRATRGQEGKEAP